MWLPAVQGLVLGLRRWAYKVEIVMMSLLCARRLFKASIEVHHVEKHSIAACSFGQSKSIAVASIACSSYFDVDEAFSRLRLGSDEPNNSID